MIEVRKNTSFLKFFIIYKRCPFLFAVGFSYKDMCGCKPFFNKDLRSLSGFLGISKDLRIRAKRLGLCAKWLFVLAQNMVY